jgi:hypothetical protein
MKIKNLGRIELGRTVAHDLRPSATPSGTTAWPAHFSRRGAAPWPAWLTSGLHVNEVFTTMTGAPRGGGRARWGNEIHIPMVGRWWRGGFSGRVPVTGSSSGGNGGDGDVLEHQEANRAGGGGGGWGALQKRWMKAVWWSSLRKGRSSGDFNSQWGGDDTGGRSGQEARGLEGARSRSRRKEDGGGSEKGHGGGE